MVAEASFGSRVREFLPGKQRLDDRTWEMRHRFMLGLLWLHVPFLATIGIVQRQPLTHVIVESSIVVASGLLAAKLRGRSARAMVVTFGLLSSSGILVHFTGGLIESHFHYFVIVPVIALYMDWKPLLLAVVYVAGQHGTFGILAPQVVYNHPAAIAKPVLWALIHASYVLFLVGVLLINWRFTDRAESLRGESEERFRRGFEEAPIGMALMDQSGKFLQVNRALCNMLGYSQDQLLGSGLPSLTHRDDEPTLTDAWTALTTGESPTANLDLRCLTKDGRTIWGRISLSDLPGQGERAPSVIAQIEDSTRTHESQERLERLVRGKDEFVASVSSEIRQPLTTVVGLAEDLREKRILMSPREIAEMVDSIATQSQEIAGILENLLVAARADSGSIPVIPRSADIDELSRESMAGVPGSSRVLVDSGGAQVWADPERVRQILRSLIGNAVRYGGPHVRLVATSEGPETVVQVCDDGPEIPLAEQERIFQADLRNGTPVTQPASVGLGLTVARHLARLMAGDLIYRRSSDNVSIFELRLPSGPPNAPYHVQRPWLDGALTQTR